MKNTFVSNRREQSFSKLSVSGVFKDQFHLPALLANAVE